MADHPIDHWVLAEHGIDLDALGRSESLFALSNGHLGLRGNLDEGEPRALGGTYLSGFYESYPLQYGERGYGFAEDGQVVVNVTDGKLIRLQVEDEPLDVHRGAVEEHRRSLDFRTGILERSLVWRSAGGHRVRVRTRRLVSLSLRSVAAISYEVEALDGPVRVALQSNLQANERQPVAGADPREAHSLQDTLVSCLNVDRGLRVVLAHHTRNSGLSCAAGMDHIIDHEGESLRLSGSEPDFGRVTLSTELQPGAPLKVTKLLAYHWSGRQTVEWLRDQVDASLESARDEAFEGLAASQRTLLDDYWSRADVVIEGDDELQQALRFALFHLGQASLRGDGRALAAKGLTGTGYDGHAFWDTEGYVLPVLTYCVPQVVRSALEWRHETLPAARTRAAELGLKGAALPWRTIHGEECSGYWPAGTAAFHVNAAVAGAVVRYVDATGDREFAAGAGLELLVESARLWCSLGFHAEDDGDFHLPGVTGPDEYSALVDDNVYTNLTAQQNLRSAATAAERHPEAAAALGVDEAERAAWTHAADRMHVPFDERLGIHPQDAAFLRHARWDFAATPADHYPLLLHYPYVTLYARQVVKQADLVLAMHVRGDAFTLEQKRANFDYYEAITVRDSSLSACTQAVMAAEVGHVSLAMDYLREAAFMDLRDLARNTGDGLHLASLAGAVIAVAAGLGGLRDHGGELSFRPRLPDGISRLGFPLTLRGVLLRVELADGRARYRVDGEGSVTLEHEGERITVTGGQEPAERPLLLWPSDAQRPGQPAGREPGVVRRDGADVHPRIARQATST